MIVVPAKVEFMHPVDGHAILKLIEACGRVCYKSEDKIEDGSAEAFVRGLLKRGHEAVIEHAKITVKFTCDRGVSHEIVRHRMASYCQESTRYCNYAGTKFGSEITVIAPWALRMSAEAFGQWEESCLAAEQAYFAMLEAGAKPQDARSVLPNSLKTEVVMTANMREWRHFFRLRCSPAAHPQMQEVAKLGLRMFHEAVPVLFDDIYEEVFGE